MSNFYLDKAIAQSDNKDGIEQNPNLLVGQQTDSTAVFSVATNYYEGSVVGSTILSPHINYLLFPIHLATFVSTLKTDADILKKKYKAAESLFKTFKSFSKDFEEGKKVSLASRSWEV